MALLLAVFQKMRLIRERNETSLLLTRAGSRLTRVQKNIERVNKLFASRKTRLENQAKQMANSAKSFFRGAYHLDMPQNYNPMSSAGNMFITNMMGTLLTSGVQIQDKDGNKSSLKVANDARARELLRIYNSGWINNGVPNDNGGVEYKIPGSDNSITLNAQEYQMLQAAYGQSCQAYQFSTGALQQAVEGSEASISIWLEAEQERLEEEQDEALAPLSEQETRWELEKEQAELKLKRIEADLESYTQLADNEAKNMAPKFGL